jgi:hypothetical protein
MNDPITHDVLAYDIQLPEGQDVSSFHDHLLHVAENMRNIGEAEVLDIVVSEELDGRSFPWVSSVTFRRNRIESQANPR